MRARTHMRPIELSKNVDLQSFDLSTPGAKTASAGGLFLGRCQSAIRTKTASKAKPGACLAVPVQDAVVGEDLPVTVKSTLSISNTDGCPCVCRRVVREAENLSPF